MATGPTDWEKQNKGKVASAFDKVQKAQAPERVDSQQVKKSAPGMQPKPPGNVRGAVDRQAHNERSGQDNKAANEARAKQLHEAIKKDKENQPDKGKDRER